MSTRRAAKSLFMIEDVEVLRRKIRRLEDPVGLMWKDMRRLIHVRPDAAWMLAPFVAAVTGDPADIGIARREMLEYCRLLPGRSLSIDVQQDFWCPCFQVARMGIYYSWMRELGWISGADAAACEQIFLDYAFAHMFTSGLTKHRTDITNNQTLSLSFGCTVIGHLLGYRLNSSPTARTIMAEGLKHLRLRISSMPRGGWSGEGATYQVQVVGPGVSLASMALEAVTGKDVFFRREGPEFATPAEVAEMAHRCAMPDGLMLPWDNYGFFISQVSLTSSVLARKTRDMSYLNWMNSARINKPYVCFGWGRDEKALTLLFWPEDTASSSTRSYPGWSSENVGAQYVSPDERIGFFQMCDEHGAGSEVGRPECNPNHVVYGAFGAQLFTDGKAAGADVFRFKGCQKKVATITGMSERNWSSGGPGAHSCLLIDGQEEYIPERRGHGRVVAFDDLGETALICTESAESYRPKFDVSSVQRTTALLAGGRVAVIRDHVSAETSHSFQSRFYVRPAIREMPRQNGVRHFIVDTPERVRFHLFPLGASKVVQKQILGFPAVFEGRSAVLDFHHAKRACSSEFTLVVVSEDLVEELADVTDGWAVFGGPSAEEQSPRGFTASLDSYLTAREELKNDRIVTLRKKISKKQIPVGREICLRLPRGLRKCAVIVDGVPAPIELPDEFRPQAEKVGDRKPATELLHPWVTLRTAGEKKSSDMEISVVFERVAGSNHLYSDLLSDAFPHGYGPAHLGVVRTGKFSPQVKFARGRLTVAGMRGETVSADLGGLGDGRLVCEFRNSSAYVGCRGVPGVFHASRPIKLGVYDDTIRLGRIEAPFALVMEHCGSPVEIDWHAGTLQASYRGSRHLNLIFSATDLQAVIVNGTLIQPEGKAEYTVRLPGATTAAMEPYAQDAALAKVWTPVGKETVARLAEILKSDNWQVRMAAAVALGERREKGARKALLKCFASEFDEEIFENKKEYCWFVRGVSDDFTDGRTPVSPDDEPRRFAAWSRRWRLKGQIARALGRIGGPGVEEAILDSIKDGQDFHYYVCVCQALRDCGTEKSLPALKRFLKFEEWCTQRYAEDAIDEIKARWPGRGS